MIDTSSAFIAGYTAAAVIFTLYSLTLWSRARTLRRRRGRRTE
jgi:hypothetical protein